MHASAHTNKQILIFIFGWRCKGVGVRDFMKKGEGGLEVASKGYSYTSFELM